MPSTLVIKTGASGDVVRSTVLLHAIPGDIYWITTEYNLDLFPDGSSTGLREIAMIENVPRQFFSMDFDMVINLEEDVDIATLAAQFTTKKRVGVFNVQGELSYTPDSSRWFDMSRISKLGRATANELKFVNTLSYQEHIFGMIQQLFHGEEYEIYRSAQARVKTDRKRVGIETRSGETWPNKHWGKYHQLGDLLIAKGYEVLYFEERSNLRQYMDDIYSCDAFISGDTLGMHIALAYKIPAIALFNCTSPQEIYDYGRLEKVVSPMLKEAYYKTSYTADVINSIELNDVFTRFVKLEARINQ